jgi:hypothetical protein
MPSKKKPRPLFEVPVELASGHESGWVYRSGTSAAETAPAPRENSGTGVGAESAHTLALALATLAQTFVLVMTVAVLPMTMGMRALQSLAKPNETR